MVTMSENEVRRQFYRRYDQNPVGWTIYHGISREGHPEILISHPDYTWLIKRESPHSNSPGIGMKIDEYVEPKVVMQKTGLRPVPEDIMKKIDFIIQEERDPSEIVELIEQILTKNPTTRDEAEKISPALMDGPIYFSPRPLQSIVDRQLDLDLKLERELRKLTKRRTGYIR